MNESPRIKIGEWTARPTLNLLERDGRSVKLEPRAMEVLVYLASHAGEVVSADELISAVWQGRVVGDGAVYQAINQLRHGLGDHQDDVRFIQTIPKRGYRLVAPVTIVEPESNDQASDVPVDRASSRKLGFAIAGVLVLTLAVLAVRYIGEERQDVLANSVAVLLCDNLSPDPADAYFAASIHEEILNQLVKIRSLNVIARTTVLQYADAPPSISKIAEELNVETVMECSVRFAGDALLVTAQLIDPETNANLWSETYPGDTSDLSTLFAMQADIALNIAKALEAEFSPAEQESIERIPTDSSEAYAFYLRAVVGSAAADVLAPRIADLERALEIDANFALAYALIARFRSGFVTFGVDVDTVAEERLALENAERALALDPSLGLAHIALADIHQTYWRWAEAREAFETAYELSPSNANVLAQYGRFKRNTGEYAEAIRVGARAVELDPLNGNAIVQLAVSYRFARDNEAAAQTYRRLITLFPLDAGGYSSLGVVEATRGNNEEAVKNLRRAEELFGDNITQVFRYAHLARGYSMAGEHEDAERLVAALEVRAQESPVGEAVWALVYIALGDYNQALDRLEVAMAAPSAASYVTLLEIKANPWADPVLDEPRFREVLEALWSE